jgi:hypothetical protein
MPHGRMGRRVSATARRPSNDDGAGSRVCGCHFLMARRGPTVRSTATAGSSTHGTTLDVVGGVRAACCAVGAQLEYPVVGMVLRPGTVLVVAVCVSVASGRCPVSVGARIAIGCVAVEVLVLGLLLPLLLYRCSHGCFSLRWLAASLLCAAVLWLLLEVAAERQWSVLPEAVNGVEGCSLGDLFL